MRSLDDVNDFVSKHSPDTDRLCNQCQGMLELRAKYDDPNMPLSPCLVVRNVKDNLEGGMQSPTQTSNMLQGHIDAHNRCPLRPDLEELKEIVEKLPLETPLQAANE